MIGDLDSITDHEKKLLSVDSLRFISFPEDKDQTDLELALDYAIHIGAEEVLLLGLLGGRLDQILANLLLLPAYAHRCEGGPMHEVAVSELRSGNVILVRAGETVPADGELIEGDSSFDEAMLTGERCRCGDASASGYPRAR